jgi:hypothetical protein
MKLRPPVHPEEERGITSGNEMGLNRYCEIELPPPARKTIDLEGRAVKDGIKNALRDRQDALGELVDAVRLYRKLADSKPLTLQGSDYLEAVERLNAAIDHADGMV